MTSVCQLRNISLLTRSLTRSLVPRSPWRLPGSGPDSFQRLYFTPASSTRIEYNWIRGAEALEAYEPGGYHPVMIGDVLHGRYYVVDKLGYGGYSTVWLARETEKGRYVALKVNMADAGTGERKALKALAGSGSDSHPGRDHIPDILDEFELAGPNGTHACLAMTPASCSLRDASFTQLFPLDVARALAYGVALGVGYLHSRGYVHGDIHLSNILINFPSSFTDLSIEKFYELYGHPETVPISRCDGGILPPNVPPKAVVPVFLGKYADKLTLSDAYPLLTDLGESFSPLSDTRLGKDCHTPPAFRPPEASFEPSAPLGYPADVWSLATALWELVGMKALFSIEYVPNDEILAQYFDVLGPMPSEWWTRRDGRGQFYDEDGRPKESYVENMWPPLEEAFEDGVQKWRRRHGSEMPRDEIKPFLGLMRKMLAFRAEDRITVDEVLRSEWMVDWAKRDYERR